MAAWEESVYTINKVLEGIKLNQITGIPPREVPSCYVVGGNGCCIIRFVPPYDTIIEDQLICSVGGIRIVRKKDSAPIGPEDGETVADLSIVDAPAGKTIEITDSGLANGSTYYYGFYPYSDHGVFNYNNVNIKSAVPSSIKYWAFDQNFSDKVPSTTITYPSGYENSNFEPMLTNEGTGTSTPGGWAYFLSDILQNYPFAVQKSGEADYRLDEDDYTKTYNGYLSHYNNTSYDGGMFSWLKKLYMREEYTSDGTSRRVEFANVKADGYTPTGFVDFDDNELEGLWLPMGYMDASSRILIAGTTPCASKTCDQEKALIDAFSSRAVHLGGPIMNVLRDLEYMMFKSTDIQLQAGHGRCNAGSSAVIANNVVPNGNVKGWYGTSTKTTLNKYFHSQVLGSYQQLTRDPFTLLVNLKMMVSPHYKYDITGATYEDAGQTWAAAGWYYPSTLVKVSDDFGSVPKWENTGSTSTGLCDGIYGASGTTVGQRLGATAYDLPDGPACLSLYIAASHASWDCGVGVLLLPPVGYAPEV